MKELQLTQGSAAWLAARARYFTASEAPAMMGVSKYQTRSELLRQKATGIVAEVHAATQARFAAGHAAEAACRPLAEAIIGEGLYPIVAIDDSEKFLASSDGATMLCDIGWEHKLLNQRLAESVDRGEVQASHKWQLVHQCLVFGFEKILFSVSDGTPENHHWCWFMPSAADFQQLRAGWAQFEQDLQHYQPEPHAAKPAGQAPDTLPALFVEVTGQVVASNLGDFKTRALEVFAHIKTALSTDADFADAEKTVKWCKEVEDRLESGKQHVLGQVASIDALFRSIDAIKEEARRTRLNLDKQVKAEKESRKLERVREASQALQAHCDKLARRIGLPLPAPSPLFGEAIKGLKSLDAMDDKLSVALAQAKVEASALADRIQANLQRLDQDGASWRFLFPDLASVCSKPEEDFAALLAQRLRAHQESEAARQTPQAAPPAAAPAAPAATPPAAPAAPQAEAPPPAPAAFAVLTDSGQAIRLWWSGLERERAERAAREDFHRPLVALYPGAALHALSAQRDALLAAVQTALHHLNASPNPAELAPLIHTLQAAISGTHTNKE